MRYQSTPEKEFDGDIIITDPCYIIRNENGITKNDTGIIVSTVNIWSDLGLKII